MAIGWMSALKIIPWGSVLESAPHIVKAAKHLFAATKTDTSGFSSAPPFSESSADPDKLEKRIRLLEAKIIELSDEQQASVQLIKSLAEQNALVVEAIEVYRIRVKVLLIICSVLIFALGGTLFWHWQ